MSTSNDTDDLLADLTEEAAEEISDNADRLADLAMCLSHQEGDIAVTTLALTLVQGCVFAGIPVEELFSSLKEFEKEALSESEESESQRN